MKTISVHSLFSLKMFGQENYEIIPPSHNGWCLRFFFFFTQIKKINTYEEDKYSNSTYLSSDNFSKIYLFSLLILIYASLNLLR